MVRISTALVTVLAALAASGCGGARHPVVPGPLAQRLAAESDAVAARLRAGDGCGAVARARRLERDAASVSAVRRSAAGIVAEIPCLAPVPVAAKPAPPRPAPTAARPVVARHRHPRTPHRHHPKHRHRHHGHGKRR